MILLQLEISTKVRKFLGLTRFFLGLALIMIAPTAHAVGTPSTWEPTIFKYVDGEENGEAVTQKR